MLVTSTISVVLTLLEGVLSGVKGSTATDAETIAQNVQAAITSLEGVIGTPVTYAQLEALRIKPTW
jgi:hypothetical protein